MLHKEARADIKPGAGEDIRMVVDSPVSTFQLPANGLRRIGQLRFIESAINQARFFHASVVVVGPSTFSNSSSVEV